MLTLLRREDERLLDLGLGFTGGVMLVASFTSLILPGVEGWGFWQVGLGILGGVALIRLLDLFTPHEHLMRGYEGPPELSNKVKRSWLVALAITIHNIPEGLAVGVSTAYHVELGFVTALAIAIQDVPEGVAVVIPLLRYQLVRTAVAVGVLSALVEGGAAVVSGVAAAGLPSWARHGGRRRRDAVCDRGGAVPRHLRRGEEEGISHLRLHNGGPPHVVETALSPS